MNKNDLIKSIETLQKRGHSFSVNSAMMDNILDALRTAQEREKPLTCEYCSGKDNACLLDGDCTLFVTEHDGIKKVFCADWGGDSYLDWNYCPICGRKLGNEEVAYHSRPEEG